MRKLTACRQSSQRGFPWKLWNLSGSVTGTILPYHYTTVTCLLCNDYYVYTVNIHVRIPLCRCFQVPFCRTPTVTLRTPDTVLLALKYSEGMNTSSYSTSNWENTIFWCGWSNSAWTMSPRKGPRLKSYSNGWRV